MVAQDDGATASRNHGSKKGGVGFLTFGPARRAPSNGNLVSFIAPQYRDHAITRCSIDGRVISMQVGPGYKPILPHHKIVGTNLMDYMTVDDWRELRESMTQAIFDSRTITAPPTTITHGRRSVKRIAEIRPLSFSEVLIYARRAA